MTDVVAKLAATLRDIAESATASAEGTPPEIALMRAYRRGRAEAFARAADLAEQAATTPQPPCPVADGCPYNHGRP